MELPNAFISELLTPQQISSAIDALQPALRDLLGDAPLVARFGWGCGLHPDLRGAPMRIGTGGVEEFFRDSLRQQIFVPGESDVHFELPDGRLQVVFCHEGHIHIGGTDLRLVESFVRSPQFKRLFTRGRV